MSRISHDEALFRMVEAAHLRSSCDENQGGAVLSRDGDVIVVAWSSVPAGRMNCEQAGHHYSSKWDLVMDPECVGGKGPREIMFCDRSMHAEVAALAQAARAGISTIGATLHCSAVPCSDCVKMLIHAGIVEVHAAIDREDSGREKLSLSEGEIRWFVGIHQGG
jgi:dCMP deaminase